MYTKYIWSLTPDDIWWTRNDYIAMQSWVEFIKQRLQRISFIGLRYIPIFGNRRAKEIRVKDIYMELDHQSAIRNKLSIALAVLLILPLHM